jgi:hypothetical protein
VLSVLVKNGIQVGIVIHFQLPIYLKAEFSVQHALPQAIEAGCQVVPLRFQDCQSLPVALAVACWGSRPLDFFERVVAFQSQNREPVQHQPRCFGMQFRPRIGQILRG